MQIIFLWYHHSLLLWYSYYCHSPTITFQYIFRWSSADPAFQAASAWLLLPRHLLSGTQGLWLLGRPLEPGKSEKSQEFVVNVLGLGVEDCINEDINLVMVATFECGKHAFTIQVQEFETFEPIPDCWSWENHQCQALCWKQVFELYVMH